MYTSKHTVVIKKQLTFPQVDKHSQAKVLSYSGLFQWRLWLSLYICILCFFSSHPYPLGFECMYCVSVVLSIQILLFLNKMMLFFLMVMFSSVFLLLKAFHTQATSYTQMQREGERESVCVCMCVYMRKKNMFSRHFSFCFFSHKCLLLNWYIEIQTQQKMKITGGNLSSWDCFMLQCTTTKF